MKEDPPPDTRCRDKFLVQTVGIPTDKDFGNVSQIWASVEQTNKSSIQEKKIRVNFLPADGGAGGAGLAAGSMNGASNHDDEPPAYSSPSPAAVTPQRQSTAAPSGAVSSPSDRPVDAKSRGDAVNSAYNPATEQSNSTLGAIASAIPTSQDDVNRQLAAANAKVSELQQQVTEGLRQRTKPADGSDKVTSPHLGLQNAPAPGGVPIQYVAALCLLCFLIAYLLF